MRTFRAIEHAEDLRERRSYVEDHSSHEWLEVTHPSGSAFDWHMACVRNYPKIPYPGLLWQFPNP
jgi:hypothetical protein